MATKLYLPNLLEFIYHCIVEKGFQFLHHRLDRDDYVKVRSESKARVFAETANLEDKMIFLSKLGMACALVIWDKEKEKTRKVEDIVIGYLHADPNNLNKLIVKDKIFACKDIDFIRSLQTLTRHSMSKLYTISKRFLYIRDNVAGFKTRTLTNKLQAEAGLDWYCKTIQYAFDIEPVLEGFKINMFQFRILLALHTSPNGITKETIIKKLDRVHIAAILQEMYNSNMIHYSLDNKEVITIDTYGIMILEQIFNKFP